MESLSRSGTKDGGEAIKISSGLAFPPNSPLLDRKYLNIVTRKTGVYQMFDAFSFSSRNEPGIYIYINNRSFVETFLTQRVPILEREREHSKYLYRRYNSVNKATRMKKNARMM